MTYDNESLFFKKFSDKKYDSLSLSITYEGDILYTTNEKSYGLAKNQIVYIGEIPFLSLYACSDKKSKFLYRIENDNFSEIRDFLSYWDDEQRSIVKKDTWDNFVKFWLTLFAFMEKHIDIDYIKPRYEFYGTDYRDIDGDLTIHFDVFLGENAFGDMTIDEYFPICRDLENLWFEELFESKLMHNMLGRVFVDFKK